MENWFLHAEQKKCNLKRVLVSLFFCIKFRIKDVIKIRELVFRIYPICLAIKIRKIKKGMKIVIGNGGKNVIKELKKEKRNISERKTCLY